MEQEPCEDEYIKIPKKALKYRTAEMIAYNAEWLKNHFDIERAVICGAQQPSDDAISRQAVLDMMQMRMSGKELYKAVYDLPSVNPQPCKDTRMIDKSNFNMEQYKTDIQSAYDCGKASVDPCEDCISRQAVLDIVDSYSESQSNVEDVTQDIISDIMALPPVTPQEPCEMTAEEYRQRMIQAFHNANTDELIALCVLPTEKEFEHLEWLLKTHYKKEPCEDAISRQEAVEAFQMFREYESNRSNKGWVDRIETVLKQLPPVNPQPKTGHWMIDEDSTDRFFATYECSCCKRAIIVPHDLIKAVYKDYPFCHCGAKMVEPQESEG